MHKEKKINHSILFRTVFFLSVFIIALVAELGINRFQKVRVMEPLDSEMHNIQAISGFLHATEDAVSLFENHRWDYGNPASLMSDIRHDIITMEEEISIIEKDVKKLSREQYLLANAVNTTFQYVKETTESLFSYLLNGNTSDATELYYGKLAPAWGYLGTYCRELLEQAILDSRESFSRILGLNETVNLIESITFTLCSISAVIVMFTLIRILKAMLAMERASEAVSRSEFGIQDLDEKGNDELSRLASSFNVMKRSLKERVELLEEKQEMESMLHRKETETLELQNLLEREKMQQLRSQINPHFLFNTLNVIKHMAGKEDAKETERLIGALGKLFHYALSSNELLVPLSREIMIVNEFYLLCQVRFGDKIGIKWDLSPEIDLTETLVPSFILQPMVENAVRHGLGPKEEAGKIRISARTDGQMLYIAIADDGIGMDEEKLNAIKSRLYDQNAAGDHIGLSNVACRLRMLGKGCDLKINSVKGKGTEIILTLPLKTVEEEEEEMEYDQDTDS